jgi:hypothetical protein
MAIFETLTFQYAIQEVFLQLIMTENWERILKNYILIEIHKQVI